MIVVSIIIPHFNHSALLKETIQSVKQQTFKDWEIIIVDDGSSENEFAAIKKYENGQNITVVQRANGIKGPSRCRNIGADLATGKYLIFLDSDDLLAPFCLQQRVAVMAEAPQPGLGVFRQYTFEGETPDTKTFFSKDIHTREEAKNYFLQMDAPWQTMASIWKKKTFTLLVGFDESLECMEDPDLHLRALFNTDKIVCFYLYE